MIILILTFVTLFLAVFSPCVLILHRCEQTKGFNARKQRQQEQTGVDGEASWRRNKQMILS
jgi:hypothetical protein